MRFIIRMPLGCAHLRKEEMEADKAPLFHTPAPVLPVPYETEEEENGKTRTKTKYKVLVVEDDEDIRRYICRELASDYHTLEMLLAATARRHWKASSIKPRTW